jgi:hypothetical protein
MEWVFWREVAAKRTAATCVGACGHTRGKSFATNHQAMEVACWIG